MNKNEQKFAFGIEFQEAILHFIVIGQNGYRALELVEDHYFTLITHSVIAYALKIFYKKKKRVPSKALIKETLRECYDTKKIGEQILDEDKKGIDSIIEKLYNSVLRDADEVLDRVVTFARYINLRDSVEDADLSDYNNYSAFASKIQIAISIGSNLNDEKGTFLVKGFKDRRYRRDEIIKHPTPWWQVNRWLNGGGVNPASLILVAAEAKRFKTGAFVNLVIGYMKRKKNVVIFDFENGERSLTTRFEQALMKANQDSILTGELDDNLAKLLRKFKRLGIEVLIKRFPAYKTTCADLQVFVDKVYLEDGIRFHEAIFDYADLMGAISGRVEDDKRISDVYVDIKNFLDFNKYESGWTASHVTRLGGQQRRKTKYEANDLSKAIDKIRHCDLAIGLQESDEEIEAGVMRMEVMDGRDNIRAGSALFWVDIEIQSMKEFTKPQLADYYAQKGEEDPNRKQRKRIPVEKKSDL